MHRRITLWARHAYRHAARCECQLVREGLFSLVGDRVLDLSLSGALVGPTDDAEVGERLLLSFRVPRTSFWIDTDVTVCRVVAGRRSGEHRRELGLVFDELGLDASRALRAGLAAAPIAPPGFRRGRRGGLLATRLLSTLSGGVAPRRAPLRDVAALTCGTSAQDARAFQIPWPAGVSRSAANRWPGRRHRSFVMPLPEPDPVPRRV